MIGRESGAELFKGCEEDPARPPRPPYGSDEGGANPSEYSGALEGGYGAGEDMLLSAI